MTPVHDAAATADAQVAVAALAHHRFAAPRPRLINLSENATYLVEDAETGWAAVLRVHGVDGLALPRA